MLVELLLQGQVGKKYRVLVFHGDQLFEELVALIDSDFFFVATGLVFLVAFEVIDDEEVDFFTFFLPDLEQVAEGGLFILVLELDVFFPEVNVALAEEESVSEELLDEVVVVLDDDFAENVDAFDQLLLKDGRGQDSLDDQLLEEGQVLEGLNDLVDLLVGQQVVGYLLGSKDFGVAIL